MNKALLVFAITLSAFQGLKAQCSATTAAAFMQCNYYGDRITAFSLNGIPSTGNAGCGTSGYNLFATPVRTLVMGNTYNWTASTGVNYVNGFGMWIDWNNDGQYTTAECVAFRNYAFNHTGTITVPYTAVIGVNLRMRIRCAEYYNFVATTSPCNSLNGYGETEDYFVYIECPTALPTLTVAATNTHICLGQSVTFTANGAQSYTWTGGSTPVTNGVSFNPTSSAIYTVTGGIAACPGVTNTSVRTVSVSTTPIPIVASSSPALICNGTTATLSASGANNYTWLPGNSTSANPPVSPTVSTTYTLLGYNGFACPGATTVFVSVNPMPTITIVPSSTNICEGGTVALSASGADTYTWQQGGATTSSIIASPTVPTLFVVNGSNSFGCSSSMNQVVVIKQAPNVTINASKTSICVGGTSTITASGAASYLWSTNATGTAIVESPVVTTSYSVVGTGTNGCVKERTISVSVTQRTLSVSPSTAICVGGSVTLVANAGGISTYTWTANGNPVTFPVSPNVTTSYVVAATTQTLGMPCASSGTVTVTVNPLPTISASTDRSEICRGEVITLTAGGGQSYEWSNFNTNSTFTIIPNANLTFTYSVIGTDANGCKNSAATTVLVSACNSIKDLQNKTLAVSIFPNPTKGIFTINLANLKANTIVRVYNSVGALIIEQTINSGTTELDIEKESKGVFFVEVSRDGEVINTSKIVKQ